MRVQDKMLIDEWKKTERKKRVQRFFFVFLYAFNNEKEVQRLRKEWKKESGK